VESWKIGKYGQPDHNWAAPLLRERLHKGCGATALFEGASGFANEEVSGLGDGYASCATFKESGSEGIFDVGDLAREGWLSDVAALSSSGEVALLGNRHHKPHPPQLDLCLHPNNVRQNMTGDLCLFERIHSDMK
jgi:hypothetical protein